MGDARTAWLEARWEVLVAEQSDKLAAAWPNRAVPVPATWPGYALTKVRLIRRLSRDLPARATRPARQTSMPAVGPGQAALPPLPWVERTLQGPALFGTPDLVDEVDGQLRVVDLKAGVHQHEVTPLQRRQLLLYASLVNSELGRLPETCVIRDARGNEAVIRVNQADVDAVLDEVESARVAFNASLTGLRGAPTNPSKENCWRCDYRVVCSDYWSARDSDWPSSSADLIGTITSFSPPYAQIQMLDSDETHRVILSLDDHSPKKGDILVVVNAEKAGFHTSRPRWDAHVRVIPGDDGS